MHFAQKGISTAAGLRFSALCVNHSYGNNTPTLTHCVSETQSQREDHRECNAKTCSERIKNPQVTFKDFVSDQGSQCLNNNTVFF